MSEQYFSQLAIFSRVVCPRCKRVLARVCVVCYTRPMMEKRSTTELAQLWQAWPIAGPWRLSPLAGGTNNQVWCVETADGERYVLRVFADLTRLPRLLYETALLNALTEKHLPFRLPLPIKAHDGASVVSFEREKGTPACAMLVPFLPGSPLDRNDPTLTPPAATALATLDSALASLPEIETLVAFDSPFTYGGLVHGYAPVPDPLTAVERLPVERLKIRQIQNILASVLEDLAGMYAYLPQQLLHLDYDPTNLLMQDQRVTAIFDFEFASIDLRIMDLCVALSWWPVHLMGTGREWEIIDTFATVYLADFPLSPAELQAIPAGLRLRDAGSLVHRMGRYFAGLETDSRIQERVNHTLWREAWLGSQREILLQHPRAWG